MTALETRQKMGEVASQIEALRKLNDEEGRTWTSEDEQSYDKAFVEFDALKAQAESLERGERADGIADYMKAPVDPHNLLRQNTKPDDNRADRGESEHSEAEDRATAMQAWMRVKSGLELEGRHVESCQRIGVNPNAKNFDVRLLDSRELGEFRAQSVGTATAGGNTVPEGFVQNIESAMLQFGGPRQVASVIRTDSGNDLPWPTSDDTSNKGELVSENAATTEQDVTFGQLVFNAYKYSSKMIRVSAELLQDSAFDLSTWLSAKLGERIGRITAQHYTTGTGTAQPNGIVTASTLGKTAAAAAAIAADELIDLQHSVDPSYRSNGEFMFNDTVLAAIRKLKDGQGNYLLQLGNFQVGAPATLLGDPYVVNQDMPAMTTGLKSVVFGDMSKYQIRDVANIRFVQSDQRYVEFDQTAFIAWFRTDGDLLDAGTNPVKHLIQA